VECARRTTPDPHVQEGVIRHALHLAAQMDLNSPPPVLGQQFHRWLRHATGVPDPYAAAKRRFNEMALSLLPDLEAEVRRACDPFSLAVRLAIAGNIIDMGVDGAITEADVRQAIAEAMATTLAEDLEALRAAVAGARGILYLADNAGEIVFDRLLLQRLPLDRVTVVVRGAPVINDATRDDARTAGLDGLVEVIDNGSDAPGTVLDDCRPEFRRRFAEADLVIAKGQGNFETLSGQGGNVFFLFRVKCPPVSALTGLPVGTHAIFHSRASSGLPVA